MNSSSLLASQLTAVEPLFDPWVVLLQSLASGLITLFIVVLVRRMLPLKRSSARSIKSSFVESYKRSLELSLRKSTWTALVDALSDSVVGLIIWVAATFWAYVSIAMHYTSDMPLIGAFTLTAAYVAVYLGFFIGLTYFVYWRDDRRDRAIASL